MTLQITGYASGIAAGNSGCEQGPHTIQQSDFIKALKLPMKWHPLIEPQSHLSKLEALPEVIRMCEAIAHNTADAIKNKDAFLTIGGDHSSAIGTWSGAASTLEPNQHLGLIWIDAHLDGHTFESSPSKNIHGMPLAALLGQGAPALTTLFGSKPKLLPQHTVAVGIRSYEAAEEALFKELGVRIYYMPEIEERGLETVMNEALAIVTEGTSAFGISIDLDGIRPEDAPAVGTPAGGGLVGQTFLDWLPNIAKNPHFLGAEITEFNPTLAENNITEQLTVDMIQQLFQK